MPNMLRMFYDVSATLATHRIGEFFFRTSVFINLRWRQLVCKPVECVKVVVAAFNKEMASSAFSEYSPSLPGLPVLCSVSCGPAAAAAAVWRRRQRSSSVPVVISPGRRQPLRKCPEMNEKCEREDFLTRLLPDTRQLK